MKHLVGFSGGVDSQATALWVRQRFPPEDVILLFCDAGGNEHTLTYEFVREYSHNVHPVTFITPLVRDLWEPTSDKTADFVAWCRDNFASDEHAIEWARECKINIEDHTAANIAAVAREGVGPDTPLTFDLTARIRGVFPSKGKRFCTDSLKLHPQKRWMLANRDGVLADGVERYVGLRREEGKVQGKGRAAIPDRLYDDYFGCWLNYPVADMTKAEVFAMLATAGERWNPLYDLGHNRVGCYPCIAAGKDEIRACAVISPDKIVQIGEWEQTVGKPFFVHKIPGRPDAPVDEVVKWAKTARGEYRPGETQDQMPFLESDLNDGLCMNKWGACGS